MSGEENGKSGSAVMALAGPLAENVCAAVMPVLKTTTDSALDWTSWPPSMVVNVTSAAPGSSYWRASVLVESATTLVLTDPGGSPSLST